MVITVAVLLVLVVGFTVVSGQSQFAPGGPVEGPTPVADVDGTLKRAHREFEFPVAVPKGIPADWHPNSVAITNLVYWKKGEPQVARGGWITPKGFIALVQSNAKFTEFIQAETGGTGADLGTVDAGGVGWEITDARRDERAWYRTVDGVTTVITGSATEAEFQKLAQSIAG